MVSDTVEMANVLNNKFKSIFTSKSPLSLTPWCQMKIQDYADDGTMKLSQIPDTLKTDTPIMPDITISDKGILKLLGNLNPNKAAGPDRLKPLVLRELREQIAPVLGVIYQVSLESGQVPQDWTSANVAPLHKKGDKPIAANYRPISLTCILCKVLEHVVASNLVKHMDNNGLMYELQHGFRERRSCETQLAMLAEDLCRNTSQSKQTDLILLDFSKAVDMVNHEKLLLNLH